MPKYHYCEQYSDEYDRLHLGLPSPSNFSKIITPKGDPSKQWENYAYHLLAERLLQRKVNSYTSPFMENGMEMEPQAAAEYELLTDNETKKVGIVLDDLGRWCCSPDRLVGDDGLLQIKCPQPNTQLKYLVTGKTDRDYWPQLQGELFVTGRQWVDIYAWSPELPPSLIRVERDVEFIAGLEKLLIDFNIFMEKVTNKINSMRNLNTRKEYENV